MKETFLTKIILISIMEKIASADTQNIPTYDIFRPESETELLFLNVILKGFFEFSKATIIKRHNAF